MEEKNSSGGRKRSSMRKLKTYNRILTYTNKRNDHLKTKF